MAIPVAAAGAVKAKTAVQMAAFAKSMQKTDWDGVNNAMQSIKDFAASASVVQETMEDIKGLGQDLVDLALGELMANIAGKAGELFAALEPFAVMIGNLTSKLDTSGLDQFIQNLKIFNILMERSSDVLKILFDWLTPILNWILGVPQTTPDTGGGGGGEGGSLPGLGKILDIEGGMGGGY